MTLTGELGSLPVPNRRILIVHADPAALKSIGAAVAGAAYELHFSDRADRAMEVLRGRAIDVVVADAGMPDMPGADFLRLVGRSFPGTRRIGLVEEGARQAAIDAVAERELFHFLERPWDDAEVRAAVAEACEPPSVQAPFPDRVRSLAARHARMKRGELRGLELSAYHAERGELVGALLAAQELRVGQQPRRSLRVDCEFQALIRFGDEARRATTLNVSTGGFAVHLDGAPGVGHDMKVVLRIPGGESVYADAKVANVQQVANGVVRVGYRFVAVDVANARRLELAVFDALIDRTQP